MTTTTATAENVTANDNNQTNGATAKVTPFPDRLLAEEETGFFAAFDETTLILERLQSLMGSKKKEIYNHIYENVWLKTPIASRAVVCLYRADYCNTLMYAGLNKKVESDKRTFNVLKEVRNVYLELHDRAKEVSAWVPGDRKKARQNTFKKIDLFLERRFQGQAETARVRATAQEMLPPILAPLRELLHSMSKTEKQIKDLKTDVDAKFGKFEEGLKDMEDKHAAYDHRIHGVEQTVKVFHEEYEDMKKLRDELKETQALLAQLKQTAGISTTPEQVPVETKPTPVTTPEPIKKAKAS